HRELIPQLVDLLRNVWAVRRGGVDATGGGGAVGAVLVGGLGGGRCAPVVFRATSESAPGDGPLAAADAGRGRACRRAGAAQTGAFWQQARAARYAVRAHEALSFDVDPAEGHDDFLMSLALVVEAARLAPERRAVARREGDYSAPERRVSGAVARGTRLED